MSGFDNETVYANNWDFRGNPVVVAQVVASGQLPIGTGAAAGSPAILVGMLTSPLGTISIGYSSPNITLDLTGGGTSVERFVVQTGTSPVTPIGGSVTVSGAVVASGTNPVRTNGTGAHTYALQVQISQAIASTDATKIGLCNFDSNNFSVDANGFVSAKGATGFFWLTSTQATQPTNVTVNRGYIVQTGGTGTWSSALPTTSIVGDIIAVTLDGATSWTLTQAAGQQIRIANSSSTLGATGSLVSTGTGDVIILVCTAANTKWQVYDCIGNITVN